MKRMITYIINLLKKIEFYGYPPPPPPKKWPKDQDEQE